MPHSGQNLLPFTTAPQAEQFVTSGAAETESVATGGVSVPEGSLLSDENDEPDSVA